MTQMNYPSFNVILMLISVWYSLFLISDLHRTVSLALALIGLFLAAGPTWHSNLASSTMLALLIMRLNTPVESDPVTLYRGKPGKLLS